MKKLPPLGDTIIGITDEGRPTYLNPDGSMSTERTAGISHEGINRGAETEIPTIYDGREVSVEEAIERILSHGIVKAAKPEEGMAVDPVTGRRLGPFDPNRSKNIRVIPYSAYKPSLTDALLGLRRY